MLKRYGPRIGITLSLIFFILMFMIEIKIWKVTLSAEEADGCAGILFALMSGAVLSLLGETLALAAGILAVCTGIFQALIVALSCQLGSREPSLPSSESVLTFVFLIVSAVCVNYIYTAPTIQKKTASFC